VVLIGDSGVGKSCLLLRFADDTFNESYITTIGVDFRFRSVDIEGHPVKMQIVGIRQWDTAGQERFRTITSAYYRGADGVIIVFDKTNRLSFDHVQDWVQELQFYDQTSALTMLVGNKCDMKEAVTTEEAQHKAQTLAMPYIETSAKSAFHVESAFVELGKLLVQRRELDGLGTDKGFGSRIVLEKETKSQLPCCT
jgi:Ras-related protein Rab-1A